MKRYKHIVQVVMGEMRGAGVKSGVRCVWDAETDGYTSDVFINVSYCKITVCVLIILFLGHYILCGCRVCRLFVLNQSVQETIQLLQYYSV